MSDIELVIKIPEKLYKVYKGRPTMLGDAGMDMIAQAIANGTPLSKGHGDLIDRDLIGWNVNNVKCVITREDIEQAPIIIEAEKEDGK